MSALWLSFLPLLCLPRVALSNPEEDGVVWKNPGESIEIQCRPKANFPAQNQLSVRKGLNTDEVFAVDQQNSNIFSKKMRNRLKVYNTFPNVTLELTNLTVEDTGLYSCVYTRFDVRMVSTEGNGAVLLVVKGGEQCASKYTHLFLGALIGFAGVLALTITGFLLWIIHKTITRKAKRTITNEVYEDMRGTLRR